MRVYNVEDLKTVSSLDPIEGSVALRELYLWSRWYKPEGVILFSYQLKSQPLVTKVVKLEYGRTYTFDDIRLLIGNQFNREVTIFDLTIDSDARVNLRFDSRPDQYDFKNLQLCNELAFELGLPFKTTYDNVDGKVVVGTRPLREEDVQLTFSDTDLLYVNCAEIDESNVVFRNNTSDLMAVVPVQKDLENKRLIRFKDDKPLFHNLTERETVYKLNFSIRSQRGHKLPFTKAHLVVLNKP